MRKLVIGGLLLVLAATSTARAADFREPYGTGPDATGRHAYAPADDDDEEEDEDQREPVRPHIHAPPPAYAPPPRRHFGEGPPAWREREGRWLEGRWHHPPRSPRECWMRPTPWGSERICR